MNRNQLKHIIRATSQMSGDAEIVVVGIQAIHARAMKLPRLSRTISLNATNRPSSS